MVRTGAGRILARRLVWGLVGAAAVVAAVVVYASRRDSDERAVTAGAPCEATFLVAWGYPVRSPDIWAARIGGGQPSLRQLTDTGYSRDPAISPDGGSIVFVDARDRDPSATGEHSPRGTELWIMQADGEGESPLMANEQWNMEAPSWSHDGRHVAVRLVGTVQGDAVVPPQAIGIVDVATKELRVVFEAPAGEEVRDPSWALDDQQIVFVRRTNGDSQLARYDILSVPVISADGSSTATPEVLYSHEPPFAEEILAPRISPSGDQLAFESVGELFLLTLGTGEVASMGSGRYPMWNPTRSSLLFFANIDGDRAALVERASPREQRQTIAPVQDLPLAGAGIEMPCRGA